MEILFIFATSCTGLSESFNDLAILLYDFAKGYASLTRSVAGFAASFAVPALLFACFVLLLAGLVRSFCVFAQSIAGFVEQLAVYWFWCEPEKQ